MIQRDSSIHYYQISSVAVKFVSQNFWMPGNICKKHTQKR